MIFKS